VFGGREKCLELVLYALALASFGAGTLRNRIYAPPYTPEARREGTLRVVTWNVGAGLESGGLQEEHLDHVARALRKLDPDVVFLQETRGRRQAERLRERLGEGWFFESGSGVLALCQRGWFEAFELDRAFRMRAVGVIFRAEGRDPIAAIGLHALAFSSTSRNEAIGVTTTTLNMRSETHKILAGDLNLDLDLDKRRDLFSDDEYLDVETYNFVGLSMIDATRDTGATAEPDRRLDYVFTSKGWDVLAAGTWKGQRAPGMDHDPVVVDLR